MGKANEQLAKDMGQGLSNLAGAGVTGGTGPAKNQQQIDMDAATQKMEDLRQKKLKESGQSGASNDPLVVGHTQTPFSAVPDEYKTV